MNEPQCECRDCTQSRWKQSLAYQLDRAIPLETKVVREETVSDRNVEALEAIAAFPDMRPMYSYLKKHYKYSENTEMLPPYLVMNMVAENAIRDAGLRIND